MTRKLSTSLNSFNLKTAGKSPKAACIALALAGSTLASGALADFDPNGNGVLSIPIRMCAVAGSPAAVNPPGGPSPANTTAVLQERLDSATNDTWLPGASIKFVSPVPASVGAVDFPIIADPKPPSAGGPGVEGDIHHCYWKHASCELTIALNACRTAWNDLGNALSVTFKGPVALNVRKLVTSSGVDSSKGTSNWSLWHQGSGVCKSDWVVRDGNREDLAFAIAWDKTLFLDSPGRDRNLAHELGHVLFLSHGNGVDDDGDGVADACDGGWAENNNPSGYNPSPNREWTGITSPGSLMVVGNNSLPTTITASQKFVARTVGYEIDGRTWEPAAPPPPPDPSSPTITLLGAHGKYAVAESNGDMNCNATQINNSSTFTLLNNTDGTVSLLSYHGTYASAQDDGELNANASNLGAAEKFTRIDNPDGTVSFRSSYGMYMAAESNGDMNADRGGIGPWEKFQLIDSL